MKAFMKTIIAFLAVLIMGAASVKATAATTHDVGLRGRYVLSATVSQKNLLHTMDSKGIYRDVLYCFFDDENGEIGRAHV